MQETTIELHEISDEDIGLSGDDLERDVDRRQSRVMPTRTSVEARAERKRQVTHGWINELQDDSTKLGFCKRFWTLHLLGAFIAMKTELQLALAFMYGTGSSYVCTVNTWAPRHCLWMTSSTSFGVWIVLVMLNFLFSHCARRPHPFTGEEVYNPHTCNEFIYGVLIFVVTVIIFFVIVSFYWYCPGEDWERSVCDIGGLTRNATGYVMG